MKSQDRVAVSKTATRVYKATILNPTQSGRMQVFSPGYLCIDGNGKIVGISADRPRPTASQEFFDYSAYLLLPGLIDLHTHIPQYAFAGIGGLELLPWLKKYAFPQEERFSEKSIASEESKNFFSECLRYGTTTVVAYGTSHVEATDIAFLEATQSGIRAFIGLVLMDQNSPRALTVNKKTAMAGCEKLAKKWHNKGRTQFVVSPRFALSCSRELLAAAGEFAKSNNLFLQTHLSENHDEIRAVAKEHGWAKNYTDVYASTGCLSRKTLLGHGIHLTPSEQKLIKETESVIVHCPTSNRFLGSGAMPFRKWKEVGIRIGLGSDVAGGYSLSMFNEMREMCLTSKTFKEPCVGVEEALFCATLGAAKILNLEKKTGNFAVGKDADFIVVDPNAASPFVGLGSGDRPYSTPSECLSRLIFRGHPDMVIKTFVSGDEVFTKV